jgi:DNA-binding NtrC family response regulator
VTLLAPSQQPPELELAVFVGDAAAVHPLPRSGRVAIGRADDSDVRLDHPSVSRRHAVLHLGSPLRLEDLGSQNGTFVHEPRLPAETGDTDDLRQISGQTVEIAVGECVNLGSTLMVVRRARRAPDPPASAGEDPGPSGPAMRALHEEAFRAAPTQLNVLILGETGAGKEVLASAIHRRSARAHGPFVALNCAALSESLLESELFGHERGAFTGAVEARPGLFEAAQRGTVFLDEVGDLPMPVQVKLLRVIEDRKVLRVGGRSPRSIDVRFVAATHRDVEAEVARGAFRQDLFFRLSGITLTIPPLRERVGEIAELARIFAASASRQIDRPEPPALSPEALAMLERYPWPGNIRELRNVIERAVVLSARDTLLPGDLPARVRAGGAAPVRPAEEPPRPLGADAMDRLRSEMNDLERQRIVQALEQCAGNQTQAAELLGMSRRKLVMKLEEHQLPRPRKKKL